jgi:hypothetical protein
MSRRVWAAVVIAAAVIGTLAACGGSGGTGGTPPTTPGSEALGGAPTTPGGPGPVPTTAKAAAKPLTCDQLKNAQLGSPSVRYNGYPDYIPLADGIWSGEDGANVSFRECGIGDLDGDGAADGIGSILLHTNNTTGQFYSLAVWRNVGGQPVFTALKELDDRTPVEKITISGGKATVVYLTRSEGVPLAGLDIRRTAVFKLSGGTLVEQSHTDAPYTP